MDANMTQRPVPPERWKKLLLQLVDLAICFRESFRLTFADTVLAFAGHLVKQTLSRTFRGERGEAYLGPEGYLIFVLDRAARYSHGHRVHFWFQAGGVLASQTQMMPKHGGYILAATHFSMDFAIFTNLRFAFCTFICTSWKRDPWTLDTSAFAPLSRTFREPFAEFAYQIPNLTSHIFTYYHLSRLSRSTFAFAIFREAAFSFRAGTPDQPSYKSKCGGLFS